MHAFLPNADKSYRFTGFWNDGTLFMGTGPGRYPGKEVSRKAHERSLRVDSLSDRLLFSLCHEASFG
jgi:hypothetical protein